MQRDRYGLAFTVERGTNGDAFCRADAAAYARREMEKAGISSRGFVIEAYESTSGWLVFCTAELAEEYDVYISFRNSNDFLDAIRACGSEGVFLRGWDSGSGYTVRVSGSQGRLAEYTTLLREFGHPFEAPAGYARHLEEQQKNS